MKAFLNIKLIVLAIALQVCACCCTNNPPIKETVYVTVKDTVDDTANIIRIAHLERELELTRDSLQLVKDSLGSELFVANYKLARIKKYNQIAAKGNNIKYLRGWVNRVLND